MIIALSYCHKDLHLATATAELMRDLGHNNHRCVLVRPKQDAGDVENILQGVFDRLDVHDVHHTVNAYPQAPNKTFLECCHLFQNETEPWFFFEADCCPMKRGWVDQVAAEYKECKMPMMGHKHEIEDAPTGERIIWRHMTGAGVYPANMLEYTDTMGRLRKSVIDNIGNLKQVPWDTYISNERWHQTADSLTIRSKWQVGEYQVQDGRIVGKPQRTDLNALQIIKDPSVPETAAVIHGCKDTTIHTSVRKLVLTTNVSDIKQEANTTPTEFTVSNKCSMWDDVDWTDRDGKIAKRLGIHHFKVMHKRRELNQKL
jgi:hypothetical protein